jgi:hypothetical protein
MNSECYLPGCNAMQSDSSVPTLQQKNPLLQLSMQVRKLRKQSILLVAGLLGSHLTLGTSI